MKNASASLKLFPVAVLAAVLAACGGGGGETETSNPDTGATPPTPTPPSNEAPTISGTPPSSVTAGQSIAFTPTASDPDGDTLTFSIQNRPSWLSFDSNNGRISGTPQEADVGSYSNIVISVSDGQLSDSLSAFSMSVEQAGSARGSVTLSWQAPTQNTDGTPLTDLAGYALYYGTTSGDYQNRVQVDTPGVTTFVIDNLQPNTYYFVATAIKSNGVESSYSNEAVKQVL